MTKSEWNAIWQRALARNTAEALVIGLKSKEGELVELVVERDEDQRWFGVRARPARFSAWCLCGADLSKDAMDENVDALTAHLQSCEGIERPLDVAG